MAHATRTLGANQVFAARSSVTVQSARFTWPPSSVTRKTMQIVSPMWKSSRSRNHSPNDPLAFRKASSVFAITRRLSTRSPSTLRISAFHITCTLPSLSLLPNAASASFAKSQWHSTRVKLKRWLTPLRPTRAVFVISQIAESGEGVAERARSLRRAWKLDRTMGRRLVRSLITTLTAAVGAPRFTRTRWCTFESAYIRSIRHCGSPTRQLPRSRTTSIDRNVHPDIDVPDRLEGELVFANGIRTHFLATVCGNPKDIIRMEVMGNRNGDSPTRVVVDGTQIVEQNIADETPQFGDTGPSWKACYGTSIRKTSRGRMKRS